VSAAPAAAAQSPEFIPWTPSRVRITIGLMVAIFVAAMDSTVVATALPSIAGELRGFSLYPWVFAAYLLTSTTTVPLWGRLADIFGRKRVLYAGMAVFVGASLLSGASQDMLQLVAFRGLQGIGAGCLMPVALTIVGDLFPMAQRARMQGIFSSVWAFASIVGPLLGATFVSTIGWRWIFDVNLPVGLVAVALLLAYHDHPQRSGAMHIDYLGAVLLTAGTALLLWGLGSGNAGGSPSLPVVGAAVAILVAFGFVERRAVSPTVPVDLLRHRVIGPATAVSSLAGTLMFGVITYIPLYVERSLGGSSYEAGYSVAPLIFGWASAATISGRVLLRVGYRRLALIGTSVMTLGTAWILVVPPAAGVAPLIAGSLVIGVGMGMVQTPLLIVVQSSVDWGRRGAATALNQFSRTIGGAVGVSLMGVLLEAQLRAQAPARGLDVGRVVAYLNAPPGTAGAASSGVRSLLGSSLHSVFLVFVGLAAASIAASVMMAVVTRDREVATRRPAPAGMPLE